MSVRYCITGGPMKKWHMEGIINTANNAQRKLVFTDDSKMFFSKEIIFSTSKKKVFFKSLRDFAGVVLRKN